MSSKGSIACFTKDQFQRADQGGEEHAAILGGVIDTPSSISQHVDISVCKLRSIR